MGNVKEPFLGDLTSGGDTLEAVGSETGSWAPQENGVRCHMETH